MAFIEINGIGIEYELIGDVGPAVAIIHGDRFSKELTGIRQLAEAIASRGCRVLIWDRPNCGASDVAFNSESESQLNADILAGLIDKLKLGPTLIVGGSAGSRVALICAARHPTNVAGLYLLLITGGMLALGVLIANYYGDSAAAAAMGGMEAVVALPKWSEQLSKNPGNRERMLALDASEFVSTMQKWSAALFPEEGSPVPGMRLADFKSLAMPVVVLRSGVSDPHHLRATSEMVQSLIPGAELREPPWGDREWLERYSAAQAGESLCVRWPLLAPGIGAMIGALSEKGSFAP